MRPLVVLLSLCAALISTLHAQLEPVEGLIGYWNEDWQRLRATDEHPRGHDIVALYLSTPFNGISLTTISKGTDDKTRLYAAKSDNTIFEPGKKTTPPVTAKVLEFDEKLAMRINQLWVSALLATSYSDKSGSERIYDRTLCIAGGIHEARPYRFLMGEIPGSADQAPHELQWMIDTADCLKRIAFATQEDEITTAYARLNEVLRKQENLATSPDAKK